MISWQARVLEMKCRFRGAGGVGGGAAPPPAADHSHVKQVHVECKENKRDCAGRTTSTRCLVCGFVACFGSCSCWLFVVAFAEYVCGYCRCCWSLLIRACWLVCGLLGRATEYGGLFCRRGFTLKCDFVAGAGVGDEVQISWHGGGWGGVWWVVVPQGAHLQM